MPSQRSSLSHSWNETVTTTVIPVKPLGIPRENGGYLRLIGFIHLAASSARIFCSLGSSGKTDSALCRYSLASLRLPLAFAVPIN